MVNFFFFFCNTSLFLYIWKDCEIKRPTKPNEPVRLIHEHKPLNQEELNVSGRQNDKIASGRFSNISCCICKQL